MTWCSAAVTACINNPLRSATYAADEYLHTEYLSAPRNADLAGTLRARSRVRGSAYFVSALLGGRLTVALFAVRNCQVAVSTT